MIGVSQSIACDQGPNHSSFLTPGLCCCLAGGLWQRRDVSFEILVIITWAVPKAVHLSVTKGPQGSYTVLQWHSLVRSRPFDWCLA
jgi:hypothetical protein